MTRKDNKEKKRVLVLGSGGYARPFASHFNSISLIQEYTPVSNFDWKEVDLLVFTGGHDVSPSFYGEKAHKTTSSDIHRDNMEKSYYHAAIRHAIPMVGICRGSQFLTVMNGGSLYQHVYEHGRHEGHSITTNGGEKYQVTSTHHQMMKPKGKYELLAWAEGLSPSYESGGGLTLTPKRSTLVKEPEVVWYPLIKSLAVQFHPEYMNEDSLGYLYFQELLKEYVL